MDEINWNELANKASSQTEKDLQKDFESLTKLNIKDIDALLKQSAISKQNAALVLEEIKDATTSNNEKVKTISKINNGVNFLVSLVGKLTNR